MPDALPLYDARLCAWRGAGRALIYGARDFQSRIVFLGVNDLQKPVVLPFVLLSSLKSTAL
jgi:hypothetical protein